MVANPVATSTSPTRMAAVRAALLAGHEVDVVETTGRGDATRLAREAAESGADVVVVLGGDGTQNEAANGLIDTDTALAVLPGGSTNVFARTIGMDEDPDRACQQLVESISRRSIRRIGLGAVNGRYFLFHVGMGYDAAVVRQVERWPALKHHIGQTAFVLAAVTTWACRFDRRHPTLSVDVGHTPAGDGAEPGPARSGDHPEAFMVICLNTNPYTYLGRRPLDIAPDVSLDTGLGVVSLSTLSFLPMLTIVLSIIGVGEPLTAQPGVGYSYDHSEVTVRGSSPFPYQVDGDYLGTTDELVISHQPDRIALVVP